MLNYALNYVGTREGDGNFRSIINAYNSHKPIPRGYKLKYTDAWCMAFVTVCSILAGAPKKFPNECSCSKAVELLKKAGLWVEGDNYEPSPNDLIFYHWGHYDSSDCVHTPDHVGITAGTFNNEIVAVEGNYNNRVGIRLIPVNWVKIRGFGNTSILFPKYSIDYQALADIAMSGCVDKDTLYTLANAMGADIDLIFALIAGDSRKDNYGTKSLSTIATECIRGLWGNGAERRKKLTLAGYDYNAVQAIINSFYKKGE